MQQTKRPHLKWHLGERGKMENQYGFNFLRKVWHVLGLIIPVSLYLDIFKGYDGYQYATRLIIVFYLGIFLILLLLMESVRLTVPAFERFFFKYFGFLMKESERNRFNGTVPYFLANLIVVMFFTPEIAVLSILFLVIGDPTAAYIGSRFGRYRFYNGKSREGIIGFFVAAFLIGLIVLTLITFSRPESAFSLQTDGNFRFLPMIFLALGVIASCLTEFFASTTANGLIDDNLLIPIVGALTLTISLFIFTNINLNELIFHPSLLLTKFS